MTTDHTEASVAFQGAPESRTAGRADQIRRTKLYQLQGAVRY